MYCNSDLKNSPRTACKHLDDSVVFHLENFCVFLSDADGVPAKRRKRDQSKEGVLEMMENPENPLRCPVRLYEFYLSKWFVASLVIIFWLSRVIDSLSAVFKVPFLFTFVLITSKYCLISASQV